MLDLFPSYRSRFDAIDKMQCIMDGCELHATPHDGPCLLLLSMETNPVFDGLAGGAPAEARTVPSRTHYCLHHAAATRDAKVGSLCGNARGGGVQDVSGSTAALALTI